MRSRSRATTSSQHPRRDPRAANRPPAHELPCPTQALGSRASMWTSPCSPPIWTARPRPLAVGIRPPIRCASCRGMTRFTCRERGNSTWTPSVLLRREATASDYSRCTAKHRGQPRPALRADEHLKGVATASSGTCTTARSIAWCRLHWSCARRQATPRRAATSRGASSFAPRMR